MDQSAALGGLMMLVIAVLWVVVFIPSWFHNRVDAEQKTRESISWNPQVKDVKIMANTPVASNLRLATERARRLRRTKNTMSVLATLTFVGSVTLAFFAFQNPLLFVAIGFGMLVGLFALLVAIKASSELDKTLIRVAQSKTELTASLAKTWRAAILPSIDAESDSRAWTPNPLPSPANQGRIGELELPNIASVTEISHSRKNFDTQKEINTILKKRRASA
jgi:hypothetical protein